jgi:hypothetical protein
MDTMVGMIAAVSLLLAAGMSFVAWRMGREEARRSAARVAALASALGDLDLPMSGEAPAAGTELFRADDRGRDRSRLATAASVGAFAVLAALALIIVTGRSGEAVAESTAVPASTAIKASAPPVSAAIQPASSALSVAAAVPPASSAPLELLTLTHEREPDAIRVRGLVRNPASNAGQPAVTAVVFIFTRDGGFLASGRAALADPVLAPGAESAFVVTVPHTGDVGRYRVSFRNNDRVIPHLDRRDHASIAARLQ